MKKLINYSILLSLSLFMFGCGGTPSTIVIGTSDYGNINIKTAGGKNYFWTYKGDPYSGTIETHFDKDNKVFIKRGYTATIHTITTYKDGEKNGPYVEYNMNSQVVEEGNYNNNSKKDGVWKEYWQIKDEGMDGRSYVIVDNPNNLKYEGTYEDNSVVEGSSKHYYKSGKLEQESSPGDIVKRYYENGQLESVGRNSLGVNKGLWKTYHENGQLKDEGNYRESSGIKIADDIWKFYNKDGSLEMIYDKGNSTTTGAGEITVEELLDKSYLKKRY